MGENKRGDWSWTDLNKALPSYIGYQRSPVPTADWRAVIDQLGMERADSVELVLLGLLADLRSGLPDSSVVTPYQRGERAVRQLSAVYSGLNDHARKALVWLLAHENK